MTSRIGDTPRAPTTTPTHAATKLGTVLRDFDELKPSLIPETWI